MLESTVLEQMTEQKVRHLRNSGSGDHVEFTPARKMGRVAGSEGMSFTEEREFGKDKGPMA